MWARDLTTTVIRLRQDLNQPLSRHAEARIRESSGSADPHEAGDYHGPDVAVPPQPEDATLLMAAAAGGDRSAADRLLPLVYDQLRRTAQLGLTGERAGHTLSATAPVHEAYLKLAGPREVPWAGRGHFYAAAAEAMRRILLDHAKGRMRLRRGEGPTERGGRGGRASATLRMSPRCLRGNPKKS